MENSQLVEQPRRRVCEEPACCARFVRRAALALPQTLNGESARFPEFMVQTASYMLMSESRFCSDALKAAVLISLRTRGAQEWVVAHESRSPILGDDRAFLAEMKRCFGWDDYEDDDNDEGY